MSSSAVFDQSYYLTNNADVVVAISQGFFASAVDHYNTHGGRELRQPNATFNPNYYAINNADVLNAVSTGTFANVFAHYQQFGESENRAPNTTLASFDATAYLAANADVAAAVTAGTVASALDHFIAFGQTEGRTGSGVTEATNPGSTFSLTSSADGFTGTAQSDTFNATLVNEGGVANVQTMNALDSLDGGDGTDTINIQISADVTPTALTSIENVVLTAVADAAVGTDNAVDTFGAANASGMTSLTFSATGDDDGVTVTGAQNLLSGGITLKNSAVNTTVTSVNTAIAGSADALTINLESVTAGTLTIDPTSGTNGYETFTINSNGAAGNTLAGFDDGTSTSGATLNIGGAQNFTLTAAALPVAFTTVSAANATGNVTLNLTGASVMNATGGTGDDVLDLSGSFVDGTTAASRDTVNGGDGTDILILEDQEVTAVGSAAQFSTVTNIETVRMDTEITATSNFSNLTGVTTIEMAGSASDAVRATDLSYTINSGTEIQFDQDDTSDANMTFIVTGSATTDSMVIDINGVDNGAGILTYTGIETVNIANSGTSRMDGAHTLPTSAANEAMNISGTGTLTMGAVTADTVTSTMTGTGTLTLSLAAATNFTGGANVDSVVGSASADIMQGGASADTIQNQAVTLDNSANDILTGGDGFDTFILVGDSASAANYNGSPTITDFTVGTSATTTDFLAFTAANGAYNDDSGADSGLADAAGDAAVTAGDAVVIQTVAQSAGAAAVAGVTTNFFKLTTAVAFTTSLQGTFNAAIGTSTITGLTANTQLLYSLYDTTNEVMVIGSADINGTGTTTVFETADVVNLIATVGMTAAEYATIDADNFGAFIA